MMKSKKLFYLIYFIIFIIFGFYNYLYPTNKWFVLIYTIITIFLLIKAEALYDFKASNHLAILAILLIITYASQDLLAKALGIDGKNFPGNNAIVLETALSILAIYKILNYKIKPQN